MKTIDQIVPIVNARYGLSANDDSCRKFYKSLLGVSEFELNDGYYLIWMLVKDERGAKALQIVSRGAFGNPQSIFRAEKRIMEIAKKHKVDFILQGSDMDERFNDYLVKRQGYVPHIFRKEVSQ